jgi:pimeloyl-ACP methyl ester carboxylesterase
MPLLIQAYFRILNAISPKAAAKKIYTFMSNPRLVKLRPFEIDQLNKAEQTDIQFRKFRIRKYKWGNGTKKCLCIHGWEGQAGNFGGMIETLKELDYEVIAFDGPSHGASSKGYTTFFDYIDLASEIALEEKPDVIISHSFGSIVTSSLLRKNKDFKLAHWLMITSPLSAKERMQDFTEPLGVSQKTVDQLINLIEEETGESIDDLNVPNFVSEISNLDKLTMIHGLADKILPVSYSEQIQKQFKGAELIPLDDLGHYRILWADSTKSVIKDKLKI